METILNQNIIDKYILNEFNEIPNPPTEDEIKGLINDDKLTLEVVKLWALFGRDLLIEVDFGKTIIHSASRMGQIDIIEYVLNKGNNIKNINVDILNDNNSTPLIYASCRGQIKVINLLLERGANINHQDTWGWSALHHTCEWNHLEVVKVLIENDIDIQLKNNKNKTPLNIAQSKGYQEIVDYLIPFYNK